MSAPRTSPPVIGIIRRTPWPISPVVVTPAMWAVMVNTYLVCNAGVIGDPNIRVSGQASLVSHHALRQPGRQQRKHDQDDQPNQIGRHERDHASEDRGK